MPEINNDTRAIRKAPPGSKALRSQLKIAAVTECTLKFAQFHWPDLTTSQQDSILNIIETCAAANQAAKGVA